MFGICLKLLTEGLQKKIETDQVRFKMLYPERHMSRKAQIELKRRITKRLRASDNRCKLPKASKPRVRVRLQRDFIIKDGQPILIWRGQ